MASRRNREWELPDSQAAPESAPLTISRRSLIVGGGMVAAGAVAGGQLLGRVGGVGAGAAAREAPAVDPSRGLYPAARNRRYTVARAITPEEIAGNFNNFYEFGTSKAAAREAAALAVRPWQVKIDGLVEREFTIGIDDLLRLVDLEERVYRHRCVEAWSMVVPWTGFPLKRLVDLARPLGSAKYLRTESFDDPETAGGQRASWYPWPYVEGLRLDEATNELAFAVTGAYGKPLAKSMGAPLRLALPWKFGFKSAKSLVRFSFVEERPVTFWQTINAGEYGFWANVNPAVPHPRWSQALERDIASNALVPTQMFNGYGDFVASMYAGLENERLYV